MTRTQANFSRSTVGLGRPAWQLVPADYERGVKPDFGHGALGFWVVVL